MISEDCANIVVVVHLIVVVHVAILTVEVQVVRVVGIVLVLRSTPIVGRRKSPVLSLLAPTPSDGTARRVFYDASR